MAARITESEFLKRARERFGDHFDYSEIKYRSYKSPVKIRCNHHPVQLINITPEKHLQTTGGCRHCLRERRIAALERELNRDAAQRQVEIKMIETTRQKTAQCSSELKTNAKG